LKWHPSARYIREEVLGLTPARLRGIQEAQGELLVFVDDDSVLDSSDLEVAETIAKSRPDLGCWGAGRIEPEYEKPPPACMALEGAEAEECQRDNKWDFLHA
jgi:hypothetical protein